MSKKLLLALFLSCLLSQAGGVHAQIRTTVPISAELATSIAASQFPLTIKLGAINLYLTEPSIVFVSTKRVAIEARLQAYDSRPDKGIAISETGRAQLSGELDYDPVKREVVLNAPRIDKL
jgi:hypothetical protein